MEPLVDDMVQDEPSKRPSIQEVVRRFDELRKSLRFFKLRSRLVPVREDGLDRFYRVPRHFVRTVKYVFSGREAVPLPL